MGMAPFGTLTLPSYGTYRNTSIAVYQEVIFFAPWRNALHNGGLPVNGLVLGAYKHGLYPFGGAISAVVQYLITA
jgi:hypothetical protein